MGHATRLPRPTTAPARSRIEVRLAGSYFHDAWAIAAADPTLDALGQFLRVAQGTPAWIEHLMALRNRIVSLLGLKNLGSLSGMDPTKPAQDYQLGDRVGIFTVLSRTPDEVWLGDQDKHLDVVVSVHRGEAAADGAVTVTVTTVVHVHNWLGRLYMIPVAPAHRVIARTMVRAIGRALN